jgi:hypothetical protein
MSGHTSCDIRQRTSYVVRQLVALLLGATAVQAQTQLVIVSGIGGEPKYTQAFGQLSSALAQAANERAGLGDSAIVWFGEAGAPRSRWYRGPSTRDNVERTLARLAARKEIDEQVVVVLIGHGSGEGADTRISLPGADLTAADFAKLLAPFGSRRVAFVNLTSASGDMLPVLSGPNRVVMTATKSAFERNESQFARFFVDALARDGADTDKDARVSLLEAFRYADAETKRFYEADGKLATEHAQLADEGQLARRFFLTAGAPGAPGASGRASGNTRLAGLYAEQFALDEQIQALKKRKAGMTSDAYDAELEKLLLALALKAREIRQVERGT